MPHYKLRAETLEDVIIFIRKSYNMCQRYVIIPDEMGLPDVDVEFESISTLPELRTLLKSITDGHVMVETINIAKDYTGDRYYNEY
jgi:hypothetical protein